ncbi:PH domain-containing protein [Humisphaera borealis]|uniref:PH domain-containing protein n=1 Tax=Humisphaera borealis TaxID=2807512 RepID=A0A7M2WVK2_9BACT|nr:PH domain-containing protein [Humisphaera borealis]QOV89453.1 PH domain-containing protein [Humisphaera borealis]
MAEQNREDPITGNPLPHREADDTEQIYFQGSPMLRAEIATGWLWILIGLVVIAIPIAWGVLAKAGSGPIWWVYLAGAVIGLIIILVPWIKTKAIAFKITNYRIDVERGIIARRINTMELWHVDDISFDQGFIERVLGVGTIFVYSNDKTTPKLRIHGLPSPRPLFDSLKQRIIAVKRQRGVIKMDVG